MSSSNHPQAATQASSKTNVDRIAQDRVSQRDQPRLPGTFPNPVEIAAKTLSRSCGLYCAGSSRMASIGLSPCMVAGLLPRHRIRAPVGLYSSQARLAEFCFLPDRTIVKIVALPRQER